MLVIVVHSSPDQWLVSLGVNEAIELRSVANISVPFIQLCLRQVGRGPGERVISGLGLTSYWLADRSGPRRLASRKVHVLRVVFWIDLPHQDPRVRQVGAQYE